MAADLWGIPPRLKDVASLAKTGEPTRVAVRTFLGWFDAERRGWRVARRIRDCLTALELRTEPDFEGAHIDAEITIELMASGVSAPLAPPVTSTPPDSPRATLETTANKVIEVLDDTIEKPFRPTTNNDPIYRIGRLDSANRPLLSVTPDDSTSKAVTLMLMNDYSQLPVMRTERECKGMITWKSIAQSHALGRPSEVVRECMENAVVVDANKNIFEIIPLVVRHGSVFVQAVDRRLQGIITTSDLGLQFGALGEPFLLIGEIENHLRRIIDARMQHAQIAAACDPSDTMRKVTSAADLTFGEYKRLLENPERWGALGVRLDRVTFIATLEEVREIRNDVMHFDPEGVGDSQLRKLREFVELLRVI